MAKHLIVLYFLKTPKQRTVQFIGKPPYREWLVVNYLVKVVINLCLGNEGNRSEQYRFGLGSRLSI